MKQILTLLLWLCLPLFCLAQNNPLPRHYDYDAAGNRILRKVINMQPAPPAPMPPQDSLPATSYKLPVVNEVSFLEKIGQVEMKIYPNPATEKITLSISNIEKMQNGTLQLYSMNGQLLQTRLLSEDEADISLVGLSKGTYILKVQINEITENWKIIKQ